MSSHDDQLLLAIRKGLPEKVRIALTNGASPNARGGDDLPALHVAVSCIEPGIAKMLLRAGANPSAQDGWKRSALHRAIDRKHQGMIQELISAGADREAEGIYGTRPLHEAARAQCVGALKALMAAGVDELARDKKGRTAMEIMRVSGFQEGVDALQVALAKKEKEELERVASEPAGEPKERPRL